MRFYNENNTTVTGIHFLSTESLSLRFILIIYNSFCPSYFSKHEDNEAFSIYSPLTWSPT